MGINALDKKELIEHVRFAAKRSGVDPDLACAIVQAESLFDPWSTRFEPRYKSFVDPVKHANTNRISIATERNQQATSWGMFHVLGATARRLGQVGPLVRTIDPVLNAGYGIMLLADLSKRYDNFQDVAAAYNSGRARKRYGKYVPNSTNEYVKRVTQIMEVKSWNG